MTPRRGRCPARANSGAYVIARLTSSSNCRPAFARTPRSSHRLRHLRRLRARSGADFVEQLTDKTERVNLIVVLAGGETQQLGPQVRKPWRALPHIEAEHRHASAHGLRAHGLAAAAHELLAACVGVPLDGAPLQERAHAGNDLAVLVCTENLIRID
jgi:hypothetical protein